MLLNVPCLVASPNSWNLAGSVVSGLCVLQGEGGVKHQTGPLLDCVFALHLESLFLPWEKRILFGSSPCCGSATLPACSVTSARKLQLLLAGCSGGGVRLDPGPLPVLKVLHGLIQEPLGDLAGKLAEMRKAILKGREEP